jgi:hypothetical protein
VTVEPVTLAAVGGMVLTEGVKFLYQQASDLIRYWRERRDAKTGDAVATPTASPPDDLLEGQLEPLIVDHEALDRLQDRIRDVRRELLDYVDGTIPITPEDQGLLLRTEVLRNLLEAVYQQRLTFRGEQRDAAGPLIHGRIDVEKVAGYAAAVRIKLLTIDSGTVQGEARAGTVTRSGEVVALDVETVEDA